MPEPQIHKSYCRICQGFCAVEVFVDDGKIARIRGDASDPVSHGFVCSKALQAPDQHHGEGRLLTPLARGEDGAFKPIGSETALDDIAEKLRAIRDAHGPLAIAVFGGTQCLFDAISPIAARGFAGALGANYYGTMTIDQSAKWVAEARAGTFGGGPQPFDRADVWMMIGSNPLVSMVAAGGPSQFGFHDPVRGIRRAKARGMKLIVIDPRLSDTGRYADLFLQPYPGTDATLMAGILRVVLTEGWHDQAFCRDYLQPLEGLMAALEPFTPELAARISGVTEGQIRQAAAMFARDAGSGMAGTGTGTDMGANSNLAEHLVQVLNLVCGRFMREGEILANPGVLTRQIPRCAQPVPGVREWETSAKSPVSGLGAMHGERMSAKLADEILNPGEDRIRALICIGANPAIALPDQAKAVTALRSLELLVTIDPRMSATARLAHYVMAPLMAYERADQTSLLERFFRVPYAHFTPAIVAPPGGSDLVDDWYVFWRLAQRLGLSMKLGGSDAPMDRRPDRLELLALLASGAQVDYETVRSTSGGRIYEVSPQVVAPGLPDASRLDVLPPDVTEELAAVARENDDAVARPADEPGTFRLIVRRQRGLMNSTLNDAAAVRAKTPRNPVYVHPSDMKALGVAEGDLVMVSAGARSMSAPVEADSSLREGLVSITHGWGPISADPGVLQGLELATNLFVDPSLGEEAINGMPVMTGIMVRLAPDQASPAV